jgi:hypothetical protein
MKIQFLKLELDPPEYDPMMTGYLKSYDEAKKHYTGAIQYYTNAINNCKKYKDSIMYNSYSIYNPKVFVKINDEMTPLGVHEESSKIVINKNGYKTFGEAVPVGSDGLPEIWVFWGKKFTKLSVTIS